jgi:hypothetical protein
MVGMQCEVKGDQKTLCPIEKAGWYTGVLGEE